MGASGIGMGSGERVLKARFRRIAAAAALLVTASSGLAAQLGNGATTDSPLPTNVLGL
jgi:hypothetical protein